MYLYFDKNEIFFVGFLILVHEWIKKVGDKKGRRHGRE